MWSRFATARFLERGVGVLEQERFRLSPYRNARCDFEKLFAILSSRPLIFVTAFTNLSIVDPFLTQNQRLSALQIGSCHSTARAAFNEESALARSSDLAADLELPWATRLAPVSAFNRLTASASSSVLVSESEDWPWALQSR